MKKALLVLALVSTTAFGFDNNAKEVLDTKQNITNDTRIVWKQVDNIQSACEAESRKRGGGGFGYKLNACSFWSDGESRYCFVLTEKKLEAGVFMHEMRHCFQGDFHVQPAKR